MLWAVSLVAHADLPTGGVAFDVVSGERVFQQHSVVMKTGGAVQQETRVCTGPAGEMLQEVRINYASGRYLPEVAIYDGYGELRASLTKTATRWRLAVSENSRSENLRASWPKIRQSDVLLPALPKFIDENLDQLLGGDIQKVTLVMLPGAKRRTYQITTNTFRAGDRFRAVLDFIPAGGRDVLQNRLKYVVDPDAAQFESYTGPSTCQAEQFAGQLVRVRFN